MKHYCNSIMGLDDDEVSSMPWDVFVRTIADRDSTILTYNGTTWQHLVMIITRKHNYMVGLYNQRLINVSVPWFPSWRSVTTVFEWSFDFATRDLWTELGEVNPDYISGDYAASVAKLRKAFVRTGILGLVLSPVILIAMILYAFFTFLDEVRNSPGVIFSRTWSTLAKWRFRCFDEVPCCLQDRLASAYPDARSYTQQFKSAVTISLARFGVYALAILAAPLVIFSLVAEDVLEVNLWGEPWPRKVIWVATIVAAALAVVRSLVPGDDFVPAPQKFMNKLLKHVRLPPLPPQREYGYEVNYEWVRDAHSPFVRNRFAGYFKSKGLIFLSELTAVITVPFIFLYSMYDEAGEIVQFLKENTVPMGPGLGTKFIHSGLDSMDRLTPVSSPASSGSISLGGGVVSPSIGELGANATRGISSPNQFGYKSKSGPVDKNVLFNNKVAESVLTFKGYYPHWKPASSQSAELLSSNDVQQYGSTAYRPDPDQIVDANMISYLGRRAAQSGSLDRGTYSPPSAPPRRATRSAVLPLASQMEESSDDDSSDEKSQAMVALDPILDRSYPPTSSTPPPRPGPKGDDMV
jgi:autophagy-related protein 9